MVFYGIILDLYCSAITSILHFERGIMSYVSWLPARKRCIDAQAIMAALSAEWRSVLETVRRINNLCKGRQEGRPGGWGYMLKNPDIAVNLLVVSKG